MVDDCPEGRGWPSWEWWVSVMWTSRDRPVNGWWSSWGWCGGGLSLEWWVTSQGMVVDCPAYGWWPSLGRRVAILLKVCDRPGDGGCPWMLNDLPQVGRWFSWGAWLTFLDIVVDCPADGWWQSQRWWVTVHGLWMTVLGMVDGHAGEGRLDWKKCTVSAV